MLSSLSLLAFAGCTRDAGTDTTPPPAAGEARPVEAPRAPVAPADPVYKVPADDLPSFGGARALVTLVVFTDYQCPFARRAEETIAKLRAAYGDELRVAVSARPLPFHEQARPAALAALAAAEQGRFEQMHARLFAAAGVLDDAAIVRAATDVGLDLSRFNADRASSRIADALARQDGSADRIGVKGTPTFFVNGRRVVGAQPVETFRAVVDERLASARALVQSGVRPGSVYEAAVATGADHVADDAPSGGNCHGEPGCGGKGDGPAVGETVERVPVDGAPSRGSSSAAITIVAFDDFECPFCARAEQTLRALEQAHPGQVRIVFKNLALPMHSHAELAARAALAAELQGHFWDYHDALFAHQKALDRASLEKYAGDLGLDVARFSADLDDARLAARLKADAADAEALHVNGTPTFFVNGRRLTGAQPVATFEAAIAKR